MVDVCVSVGLFASSKRAIATSRVGEAPLGSTRSWRGLLCFVPFSSEVNVSENELMALPQVAVALKTSWHRAYNLLTAGELGEPIQRENRWYAPRKAVRAYIERASRKASA